MTVGTDGGTLALVDLETADMLDTLALYEEVQDMAFSGSRLYVLTTSNLHVIPFLELPLRVAQSTPAPGLVPPGHGRRHLFVGGGRAYATHRNGVNVFDVTGDDAPILLTNGDTPQFGWKDFVTNGSGIGIGTVGESSSLGFGMHDVLLYDLTNDCLETNGPDGCFFNRITTPGVARSICEWRSKNVARGGRKP